MMQIIDQTPKYSLPKSSLNRPLGSWEHFFWLSDQAHPCNFSLNARIEGEFSVEQLNLALAQVQQRYPLLRMGITIDENEQLRFVENFAPIPLKVVEREGEQHWERIVEHEISQPFVCTKAPLLRVVLLHSQDISDLIITCHHSIADGISAVYLIQDILQVLAQPDTGLEPLPMFPAMEDLIAAQVDKKEIPPLPHPENFQQPLELPTPIATVSTDEEITQTKIPINVCSGSLSRETTTSLVSRCRQEQTTVHGAICAAFLLALTRQNTQEQSQNIKSISPFNLRRYLDFEPNKSFGLYNISVIIPHSFTSKANLWDLARSVKEQLNQEIERKQIFTQALQFQRFISTKPSSKQVGQGLAAQLDYSLVISNLGRLTFTQPSDQLQLKAIYGPMGTPPMENQWIVGCTTLENQLLFTLAVQKSKMSSTEAKKFQTEAIQILDRALSS